MNKAKALITGASSGIGEEYARKLAEQQFDLILIARRRDKLEEISEELKSKHDIDIEVLPADLTVPEDTDRITARINNCPNLSMLINNAGFGTMGDFADVSLNDSLDMNRVHVDAIVKLTHAALKIMTSKKEGTIINVSSVSGFLTGTECVIYCATKAYVNSFSLSLQKEVVDKGIKIQSLCPGFTYTEFHDNPKLDKFDRKNIPDWMWFSSEYVVEKSLKALQKSKVIVIPGFRYRLLVELLTNRVIGPILMKFMKRV